VTNCPENSKATNLSRSVQMLPETKTLMRCATNTEVTTMLDSIARAAAGWPEFLTLAANIPCPTAGRGSYIPGLVPFQYISNLVESSRILSQLLHFT
jgi:hypothetical protein